MKIAWELGKSEKEVLEFSPDEVARWAAFFAIQAEQQKKANDKAKRTRGKR